MADEKMNQIDSFDTNTILDVKDLDKSFGDVHAVNSISFKVKKGELFAFLGVNGAGKSTTISIICGLLKKDKGTVLVDGSDIDHGLDKVSKTLGVVFQSSALDKPMSVKDNLRSRAALYGIYGKEFKNRLDELATMLDFKKLLNRKVGKLSGGQRRKIDIARALIHKPKILILDEPTTGLDPQTRKIIWNVMDDLREKENMTIFLTTHYMEEASDADYVVILDRGQIVARGTPVELKNEYTGDFITLYGVDEEEVKKLNLPYEKIQNSYRIEVEDTSKATELILNNPSLFKDYEIQKGKMDDVFLSVTGKKLIGGDENEKDV